MASSQVENASSLPFGCVLTDHNHRDACTTTRASFHKNIVRDHDTQKPNSNSETWVSRNSKKKLGSLCFTRKLHNIFSDKDDSSLSALVSPRHSRIIDRWAARQAKDVVTTLENGVEVLENFRSRSSSFNYRREVSPPHSDGSSESEISNLGASSLVQIWEKRLKKSNSTKPNAPASPGRTSLDDNAVYSVEEQCRVSEERESVDEPQSNEESSPDWEYDKTIPSDQSCSLKVQSSDERGRVADIIKRLTVTNQMQSSLLQSDDNDHEVCSSSDSASTPKQQEHKAFAQVISCPRIRGRQAFNDLIMQFESDRQRELSNLAQRGAVSKFTQRGRIQSLLRLRLLQRGVAASDQSGHKSTAPEVNKQQKGSGIMQLRGRFNTGDEHRTPSLAEVSDPRSPGREIASSTTQMDDFLTSNQHSKDTHCKTVYNTGIHCKETTKNSVSQTSEGSKEEAHPSSDITFQGTFFEAKNNDPKETVGASSSLADSNANEMVDKVEASDQQYATAETSYDEIVEEEETSDQNYDEARCDWISHISRPRSYWEERRQEWYREMLDFGSKNDEIQKLLERRTVSTFLSSDFRETMDRLMKSHMGTQTHLVNSQHDMEDQEGSMDQLMAFFQDRLRFRGSLQEHKRDRGEEEEVRRNEEEEEEEKSIISGSDHELGDYFNQSSSSSMLTSSPSTWGYRDNDAGDDSDRVVSVSSLLPSQSQSFYQDNRQYSSSTNHHSIEMEFIYDLRGQMEQLFHEMSELRKSIKSCMDMQMQLQQSNNQEVHTVKKEERKFHNKAPKKGNCCICYENKVNSVLYRCGHMCACLKCANELQWNSGKCPICRAPVIDVVRVYTDTESFMVERV